MSKCWFCERNDTVSEASIKVHMRFILQHYQTAKREVLKYNEQTVIVPRCNNCKKEEDQLKKQSAIVAFPSLILGILTPIFVANYYPKMSLFLLIIIGVIIFLLCVFVAMYLLVKLSPVKITENKKDVKDHPIIQNWMDKGWILDDGTGKQSENKQS